MPTLKGPMASPSPMHSGCFMPLRQNGPQQTASPLINSTSDKMPTGCPLASRTPTTCVSNQLDRLLTGTEWIEGILRHLTKNQRQPITKSKQRRELIVS